MHSYTFWRLSSSHFWHLVEHPKLIKKWWHETPCCWLVAMWQHHNAIFSNIISHNIKICKSSRFKCRKLLAYVFCTISGPWQIPQHYQTILSCRGGSKLWFGGSYMWKSVKKWLEEWAKSDATFKKLKPIPNWQGIPQAIPWTISQGIPKAFPEPFPEPFPKVFLRHSWAIPWTISQVIPQAISWGISQGISWASSQGIPKAFPEPFPEPFPKAFPGHFLSHFPSHSSRYSLNHFLSNFPRHFLRHSLSHFHELEADWLPPHPPIPNAKFPPITALLIFLSHFLNHFLSQFPRHFLRHFPSHFLNHFLSWKLIG